MKGTRNTWKLNRYILSLTDAFLIQKRENVYEHMVKGRHMIVFERCHQGVVSRKRRLSEVNARAMTREQGELLGKFKMAASDVISIRGQVLEYMYRN